MRRIIPILAALMFAPVASAQSIEERAPEAAYDTAQQLSYALDRAATQAGRVACRASYAGCLGWGLLSQPSLNLATVRNARRPRMITEASADGNSIHRSRQPAADA